jgi:hypothetical protein
VQRCAGRATRTEPRARQCASGRGRVRWCWAGRVKVERPRVCGVDGHELSLPSWVAWSTRDPLEQRAFERMVLGVSTQRYARPLEPLPSALEVRGVGKSAVSARFVIGKHRPQAGRADGAGFERA